jgi:non-ribosomal peptide synthetase component E (peptide arylation enzyme)
VTLDELAAYLDAQGVARQRFPERVEILDEFPLTPAGKIQK